MPWETSEVRWGGYRVVKCKKVVIGDVLKRKMEPIERL